MAELCRQPGRPKIFPGHNVGYYGEPEADLRDTGNAIPFWVGCTAGCSVIGIESNGNVKGCLSLPSAMNGVDAFVEGNMREQPLRQPLRVVERLKGIFDEATCASSRYDNRYCYFRQLEEKRARDAAATMADRDAASAARPDEA